MRDRPARGLLTSLALCRRGSTAIEFAFGFPIFLALIYMLFEFARIFWSQSTLEYAIEEAARFAMVNPNASATDIATVVTDSAIGLPVADVNIVVTFEANNTGKGTGPNAFVNITGTYNYSPMVPIVVPFFGTASTIDFQDLEFDIVTSTRMALVL